MKKIRVVETHISPEGSRENKYDIPSIDGLYTSLRVQYDKAKRLYIDGKGGEPWHVGWVFTAGDRQLRLELFEVEQQKDGYTLKETIKPLVMSKGN